MGSSGKSKRDLHAQPFSTSVSKKSCIYFCYEDNVLTILIRWIAEGQSTRIPLSVFYASLKVSGIETSPEETECFVANMIHKGYIRGYISHERQIVVLAQTNAFPKIIERPSPFASMTL